MRTRRVAASVAAGVLMAAAVLSTASPAGASLTWGPVRTVSSHGFDDMATATDDSGLTVAAWIGQLPDQHVYIAVHKPGKRWSIATPFPADSRVVRVATGGAGAWVMWSYNQSVRVAHITADGVVTPPEAVGHTLVPLQRDSAIAVSANDSVVAAWREYDSETPGVWYYLKSGGFWQGPQGVPDTGKILGLAVNETDSLDLALVQDNPDFWHQRITYWKGRLEPDGGFGGYVDVATSAYLATAASSPYGGLVVGWQQDNGDGTFSAVARYKPDGERAAFGPPKQLFNNVPFGSHVALAMSDSGYAVAVSHIAASGSQQFRYTPVTSSGQWLSSRLLAMTGFSYDVSISPDGDALVTSRLSSGLQLDTCPAQEACAPVETNPAVDRFPSASIADNGVVNLLWGRGCFGRTCTPTSLVAQRAS